MSMCVYIQESHAVSLVVYDLAEDSLFQLKRLWLLQPICYVLFPVGNMVEDEKCRVLKCPSQLSLVRLELSVLTASPLKRVLENTELQGSSAWLPILLLLDILAWPWPGWPLAFWLRLRIGLAWSCSSGCWGIGARALSCPPAWHLCAGGSGPVVVTCPAVQQDKAKCRLSCTALQLLPEMKIFKYIFIVRDLGKK